MSLCTVSACCGGQAVVGCCSGGGGCVAAGWLVPSPSPRRQVVGETAALWLRSRVVGSRWLEGLGFNIAYNSFGGTVFAVDETIYSPQLLHGCNLFILKLNQHDLAIM